MKTRTIAEFCQQQAWREQTGFIVRFTTHDVEDVPYADAVHSLVDQRVTAEAGFAGPLAPLTGAWHPFLSHLWTTRTWPQYVKESRN